MNKSLFFLLFSGFTLAQAPADYYNSATGLSGYSLKTALHKIISHKTFSYNYSEVGSFYPQTDADLYYEKDNSVLDIYSENPTGADAYEYNFTQNIGAANAEGKGWNKEHIMPQSTFYSDYPMNSDLHFIVPADARINQLRSNYPYGKCGAKVYYTFSNGSQICTNGTPNATYTGSVYEPIDEFKGDVARSILYFAIRYEGKLGGFLVETDASPAKDRSPLNGTEEQAYDPSFLALLLSWNAMDPVSQREIDRNNAIYLVQKNRNPLIDHPEFVNLIWQQNLNTSTPQAVANLQTTQIGAHFIILKWDASSDASTLGYKIYQNGIEIGKTTANSFVAEHLNPNANYNFSVKAYNNSYLESADSNVLATSTLASDGFAKDLIITKYLEGSGDNKALEITNNTGHEVNLNSYNISIQFKGSKSYYFPDQLELEGNLANGKSMVVINPKAQFNCFDVQNARVVSTAPALTFNGSDYISLRYKNYTVDALGYLDTDNYASLANVSLYRKTSVVNPTSVFSLAEWEQNPADFCDNLGILGLSQTTKPIQNLVIYPNPVSAKLFVKNTEKNATKTASVITIAGQTLITEKEPFKSKDYIDVHTLKSGVYFLNLDGNYSKFIKK